LDLKRAGFLSWPFFYWAPYRVLFKSLLTFFDASTHNKKTNTGFTTSYTGLPTTAEIVLQDFIVDVK